MSTNNQFDAPEPFINEKLPENSGTLTERVRRYVAKMPAAISGQGGHNATFAVAIALIKGFNLRVAEARPILAEYNRRCEPPWSAPELEHKLVSADGTADDRPRGYLVGDSAEKGGFIRPAMPALAPPPPKPSFKVEKLRNYASRYRSTVSTAWLADRSAIDPFRLTPENFLEALYSKDERVILFTNQKSQGQAIWPDEKIPAASENGVWFLPQPVDGKSYPNPRTVDETGKTKMSRRSEESVTSFRFLVLESDEADPRDWLAALVRLPLAIAAIYTSGKRSIHALVRVDAPTIGVWREFSSQIKSIFVTIGADQQVVSSAVRLSRLPGCLRGKKLQKLLYLNPSPSVKAISTLPPLRDSVKRWTDAAFNHLPYCAADVLERYDARNLDEAIEILDRFEKSKNLSESLADCLFALDWFAQSPKARELLEKLRAR